MQISEINFKSSTKIEKLNRFLSENYKISIDNDSSPSELLDLKAMSLKTARYLREEMGYGPQHADYVKNLIIAETIDLILAENANPSEGVGIGASVLDTVIAQFYPAVDFWWSRGVPLDTCLDMALLQYRASEFVLDDDLVLTSLRQRWEEENAGMSPEHSAPRDEYLDAEEPAMGGMEMEMDIDAELEEADLEPIEFYGADTKYDKTANDFVKHKEVPPTLSYKHMTNPGKMMREPPTVVPVSRPKLGKAEFSVVDKGRETFIRNDSSMDFTQYAGMAPDASVNINAEGSRGNVVAAFFNGEIEENFRIRFNTSPLSIHSIVGADGISSIDPALLEPESIQTLLADLEQSIITKQAE